MKNIFFFFSIALIFLFSCKSNENNKNIPEGLISEEKMATFLMDAHIAEAYLTLSRLHGDSLNQYETDYYYYLLKKHNIKKEYFITSMNYYIKYPDKLEIIYESVNEKLNTQEGLKW